MFEILNLEFRPPRHSFPLYVFKKFILTMLFKKIITIVLYSEFCVLPSLFTYSENTEVFVVSYSKIQLFGNKNGDYTQLALYSFHEFKFFLPKHFNFIYVISFDYYNYS